ncbi:hypothetical protein Bca52824_080182 [Brassica carinata]|uniref:MBD domain-containing protein n=1 Tax=Brassica carinata TaxID=52824 RepID=A0A8X7Q112_BRACI|nr:hypothetical protein Bca52824_080182 [Brassica carinata]
MISYGGGREGERSETKSQERDSSREVDRYLCGTMRKLSPVEDLDYDSSRTWVIDKPGLPKTPKGFKRSLVLRKDYSKMDTYYFTPTGKKLRSRNEVASYVEANPEFKDAPLEDFSFTVTKVMEDTFPPDPKVAPHSPVATPSADDYVSDKSTKSKHIKGKFKLEDEI